jgi:hypothetical protein
VLRSCFATNPDSKWVQEEVEAHQVVTPADNSQFIGTGQSSTYGTVTQQDVQVWKNVSGFLQSTLVKGATGGCKCAPHYSLERKYFPSMTALFLSRHISSGATVNRTSNLEDHCLGSLF